MDLTSTSYSDNTPAVAITYNRLGQKLTSGNGVAATAYGYDANLRLVSEANTGVVARTLTRGYDTIGRASGIAVLSGTAIEQQVTYGYGTVGRLASVTQGSGSNAKTFSYSYLANSQNLIASVTGSNVAVTNTWEAHRDVLTSKENRDANGNVVSRYEYIVNSLGQRTSVKQSGSAFTGNAFNLYGYDTLGQLTSAQRYSGSDLSDTQSPINGQQFGFAFDTIGNRTAAILDTTGTTNYTANALNQYTAIESGTTPQVAPTYDEDGNTLTDGALTNTWDGENRLVSITKPGGTVVTCAYDEQSRRVRKTVTSGSSITADTAYVYEGWNMIAEYSLATTSGTTTTTLAATNTWGIDLSGSQQGTGGVGGLLARTSGGAAYAYTYDGNGNASEVLDAGGAVAHYEYGPFGEPLRISGVMGAVNPFRFSTNYTDNETGLIYGKNRYYDPIAGRWINRDPFEEDGGLNLYAILNNDPIDGVDPLGLAGLPTWIMPKEWAYEHAKRHISGAMADFWLRHYLWGGGSKVTLGSDAVLNQLKPDVSLTDSQAFMNDLSSSGHSKRKYKIFTFDSANGLGGLGHYYVHVEVTVCKAGAYWSAQGTATVTDDWDFDWKWKNLLAEEWQRLSGVSSGAGRADISNPLNAGGNDSRARQREDATNGRQRRTALGSLIPGDPFKIGSQPVKVQQRNNDAKLKFLN